MEPITILHATITLTAAGLLMGFLLVYAHEKLSVPQDENVKNINEALPQVNCGACGYPGCSSYADAIALKNAPLNLCAPGGEETAKKIALLMGASVPETRKMTAFIRCKGDQHSAELKYAYHGILECAQAEIFFKGPKTCEHSCLGLGSCFRACMFDAITIHSNLSVKINPEKCTACGMCVNVCPRNIISFLPFDKKPFFQTSCQSVENALSTRKECSIGCFGCGLCAKNCIANAITVKNNLAAIDYNLCVNCGECEKICPAKSITRIQKKKHLLTHFS